MARMGSLIATAGLALGLLAGCGREPYQPPAAQPQVVEMAPIGEVPERATMRIFDLGRDAEVQILGENFRSEGAYYATYGPEIFATYWPIGLYPAPITVAEDGEAVYIGVFPILNEAEPGDRIYVLYDADGVPGERYRDTVPVLSAPIPDSLIP